MPSIYDIETENESFIGAWLLDDNSICDEILDFWKNGKKAPGEVTIVDNGGVVDKTIKNSSELFLDRTTELYRRYTAIHLQSIVKEYIEKYYFCNGYSAWSILEEINIQGYPKGGGYFGWHTERFDSSFPMNNRHLVFMTYLNDVFDEGYTEFFYQKLKVQPRKGLTLIWPADWTHTHRGVKSETEEKYIATGWFSFYKNMKN
jgi:hypothetical protein